MVRCLRGFAFAAVLVLAASRPAAAQTGQAAFTAVFGYCGDTCVIRYNPGGEVKAFQAAARAVRAGAKRLVVIDGPCISACAIFADMARSRVCITSRARFGFHKASILAVRSFGQSELIGRQDPPHSRDIAAWVKRKGGFPVSGLRVMSAKEAGRYWRRCTSKDLRA